MHEISIADRLLKRALETASDNDAERITGITVAVGEATHLNPTQLTFWLEELAGDTPAAGMDVDMRTVPAAGRCACGWSGTLDRLESAFGAAPDRRCPECGETTELTAGLECRLEAVSVPDEAEGRSEPVGDHSQDELDADPVEGN